MTINLADYEAGKKYDGNFDKKLRKLQDKLADLQARHIIHGNRTLIVFEGWDAAGKGGAIKRLTAFWDPRYYEVHPIFAPTEEEKDKHFLWRFWNKLPGAKEIAVLDRSYYGRVLVERVEGFCSETEWRRGYDEINEFESRQGEIGTNIIKIFLHVTQESQDKVLTERLDDPTKRWKVGLDDFRNRDKRNAYLEAMSDMFERTDTRWAPWKVIDGNSQKAARIAVLEYVIERMEAVVPKEFPDLPAEVLAQAKKDMGYEPGK